MPRSKVVALSANSPYHFVNARFVGKHEAIQSLKVSETTLKLWRNGSKLQRREPILLEGVHWCQPPGSKTAGILYNVDMIRDFICNPQYHDQAVQAFLASMPSSMAIGE